MDFTDMSRADAPLSEVKAVLLAALICLRDQLVIEVEAVAVFPDGVPDMNHVEPEDMARLKGLAEVIRAAEAIVGRPLDDCPAWLNALLDGGPLGGAVAP